MRDGRCRTILTATALLGAVASSFAQTIQTNTDLAFGKIVASGMAGTVTVTPLGTRTSSGGATPLSSSFAPATFTVSGTANATFAIVLPSSVLLMDGSRQLTVDTFQSLPSGTGVLGRLGLGGLGEADLTVGATLHLSANQARGSYSGSFEVTVVYP